ncbi:MAG TPA: DUF2461 domain-containing protein [Bacteroidota bacterium]|nr:DUF2461 domain-containing protein [Bacteroidota bacterium]
MRPMIEDEFYPPFNGFPEEMIPFFKKLKRNNNREWFAKHKQEYEEIVKFPMQCYIASIAPLFAEFAPEFDVDPKRSIFRIYRDTRFSSDKTPYKTHAAAHFVLKGMPKGLVGSGYYFHIEPGEVFLGAGIYIPDGTQIKKIRAAIDAHAAEFLSIINNKKFIKRFGTLTGEKLQRVPTGFAPDHPMADYLKLKQFFVGVTLPEASITRERFLADSAGIFEEALPFVRFLNEAII